MEAKAFPLTFPECVAPDSLHLVNFLLRHLDFSSFSTGMGPQRFGSFLVGAPSTLIYN